MAMHAGEIAKLAYVDLKNFWPATTKLQTRGCEADQKNRFMLDSILRHRSICCLPLSSRCNPGPWFLSDAAGKCANNRTASPQSRGTSAIGSTNSKNSRYGAFFLEIVGFIANGVPFAAFHPMVVVIEHPLERSDTIDHGLIALETLLSFPLNAATVIERNSIPCTVRHGCASRFKIWTP